MTNLVEGILMGEQSPGKFLTTDFIGLPYLEKPAIIAKGACIGHKYEG